MIKLFKNIVFFLIFASAIMFVDSAVLGQPDRSEILDLNDRLNLKMQEISTMSALLVNPAFVREIEAVPDQVAAMNQIFKESASMVMNHYNALAELGPELGERVKTDTMTADDMNTIAAVYSRSEEEFGQVESRLGKLILPHQVRRYRELAAQHQALANNPYGSELGLVFGLADRLELTPQEKKDLEELTKTLREEYFHRTEILRDQLNEKLVDSLSPEQKAKYQALVGDRFDAAKESRKAIEIAANDAK